jgi:NAD(P)-dependent dehydrogenase (short-subunit alcohol dehydrogenase family)
MKLEDSAAIVFGAASGLGEATARALKAQGANVVLADIAENRLQALGEEISGRACVADVTSEEAVEAAVDVAGSLPGGLRICVNCAGVGTPAKLVGRQGAAPLESFRRTITVNLIGTINVLRLAAARMSEADPEEDEERGVCINTASVAAFDGQIGQVGYSASKGGIVGLTLPAARDLAASGIRVATIAPGIFDTPLLGTLPDRARESLARSVPFPQRLGYASEYAALVEHIVVNRMLNGETIRLDGSIRMAPR